MFNATLCTVTIIERIPKLGNCTAEKDSLHRWEKGGYLKSMKSMELNGPLKTLKEWTNSGKLKDYEQLALRPITPPPSASPTSHSKPVIHETKASSLKITLIVSFYIVTSISMIMINKLILNQAGLPLIFLWGQLVVAVFLLKSSALLGLLTLPPVSLALLKSITPLISINVIGLVLNTLCLQHIDAVLYQVARSLILPITVAMSPFLQSQKISFPVILCCTVITIGFIVGIFGERTFQVSAAGIFFGVVSSFTTALHSFIIKSSFQTVKNNGAFDLVYYNNLFSSIFLAPLLLWEVRSLVNFAEKEGFPGLQMLIVGTLVAGATGMLINLAGFLQIKVTSPLTHTVSSAARGVLQTITARAVLGEPITLARSIGILVTLAGSCMYSLIKSRENKVESEYGKAEERSGSS